MAFVSFGLFAALTTVTQGHAYTLTLSSYVEAVKQVEILFAMAVGVLLFGEAQRVRQAAAGAAGMVGRKTPAPAGALLRRVPLVPARGLQPVPACPLAH